jgi:glycosyltransferase involved in cell wall biosynthesis
MSPSLGVLIPTRNSAGLLPGHLAAMSAWIDRADQVVVVDSFSTDGTLDLLREALKGRPARFVSHPPGLYASWNAGIQQLATEFAYISTVGDTITREGIERLLATADGFHADVVLSKPVFHRSDGKRVHIRWPVDDAVASLVIGAPRRLHPWEAMLFAATHPTAALTGSCASDLFRTSVLRRWPFPTEFGTAGDGVWGLRYAPLVSWVVLAEKFSTFLLHPTTISQRENRPAANAPTAETLLREATVNWKNAGAIDDAALAKLQWADLLSTLGRYLAAKDEFDRRRRGRGPWIASPNAWRARHRRNRELARLNVLKCQGVRAAAQAAVGAATSHGRSGRPENDSAL